MKFFACSSFIFISLLFSGAPAQAAGADPIAAKWTWEGTIIVEIWANGRTHMYSPIPVDGRWSLTSAGKGGRERKYVITWNGGQFVDTISMTADHLHMYGQNQLGWGISANRVGGEAAASDGSGPAEAPAKTAKKGVKIADLKPIESVGEEIGEVPVSSREKLAPGVVPKSAAIVPVSGDTDSALGDIQVTFTDGHSEVMTKGGKCSLPQISAAGDVGWDRPDKITSDRYGRNADLLHLSLHDGSTRNLKPNALFIMKWGFTDHDSTVVITSMHHHGPASYIKYDLKTGRVLGQAKDMPLESDLPKWAQPFAD